ncbi:uncharacterized protein LOC114519015 [Dendronephthya gigantea]|uniref:uncharacterized protein LOC114519015 n=1 Tax=Dendronephthya gigantea TaxID=151771 RepID=UPI00106B6FC0|nr:uncharacterized protein LOC114519015 [Dendronephthya gigantea]
MAQIALKKTAEEGETSNPRAARTVKDNTYMDDILDSVDTVEEAKELSSSIDVILAKGGFNVKEWRSNEDLDKNVPTQQVGEIPVLQGKQEEKVLGVGWNNANDVLKYKVEPNILDSQPPKITKRTILSQISRVYDPIGLTSAFLIRAKMGIQELWQKGIGWDDELSTESREHWVSFFEEMKQLSDIVLERCLCPFITVELPTLCIFADASRCAFGTCAYIRNVDSSGSIEVRFVAAKSRVAPLKELSIPRLELQAAVLASRLCKSIQEETRVEFEEIILFTDSTITLAWIRSKGRRFKPFVSNRVGEIQSNVQPCQWRHIPSEHNVADDVSRGIKASELSGRWKEGPEFLRRPKEEWPQEDLKPDVIEIEKEVRKKQMVASAAVTKSVIDCNTYSSWKKLVRVTSWVLRLKNNLLSRMKRDDGARQGPLTAEELELGRIYWIKLAQMSLKERLKRNDFKTLSPFVDPGGIIRVGGRVDNAVVSYETRHPALLPYHHRISRLITEEAHRCGHSGIATTTAKTRRMYWIIRAHDLAKAVKYKCVVCKAMEPKAESQFMANLPPQRLAPQSPPFHYTSCDYFGPLTVKVGRNKTTKHYGVIFTCLNARAVHLEIATDCTAMELIQTLRRFFAIRGYPALILSDNGTNLVGAVTELRKMISGWDKKKLHEYCADKGIQWKFTTPGAPHQNGCAESLIKSCKRALKIAIGDHVLTPFELYTCLLEVGNLVNQRPIGRVPNDPDDGSYICPNDLLLGRASTRVPQGPFEESRNPRRRVEFVQKIVNSFWKRWVRDVFPLLVPRKKWNVEKRNVKIDDFVIVADNNAVRGNWISGRIIEVYPGQDGRVRNVKVKTPTGEYSRPITKIVVIQPAEGDDNEKLRE